MVTYSSKDISINAPAEAVYSKMNNLEGLASLLNQVPADQIPEDKRGMLESLDITSDSITIPGGPVGSITLRKSRSIEPTLIEMTGENSPVPLGLSLHITEDGPDHCHARAEIALEIPAMLKPMISGPMQKMVEQFGDVLSAINFA